VHSTSSQRVERVCLDLLPPRMARDEDPADGPTGPARTRGARGLS
jgi:hypothetical protein